MKKIIASDYKGKWFVLEDAKDENDLGERPEIDIAYVTNEGLPEHIENCRYYGIPAYLGDDKELRDKIAALEKVFDKLEKD